jgi:plastocyanin
MSLVIFTEFTMVIFSLVPLAYAQSDNIVSIVSDASKLGDKAYDPSPITISQGDIVVWVNNDFGIYTQ